MKIKAEELDDLAPPSWLGKAAAAHWDKHAAHLAANRLLTVATSDSWALACDLWGMMQEDRQNMTPKNYLDTLAKYASLAKLFRLVPCDKPGAPVGHRHEDAPAFTF